MLFRITLFFAGGQAYFFGLAIIALSVLLFIAVPSKRVRPFANLLLVLGVAVVLLSSTAAPIWFYSLLVAVLALWLVFQRRLHLEQRRPRLCRGAGLAVVAVCAAGAALEWQWRSMPRLERDSFPRLYVIGDSISAGMTHDERTWPTMLAGERGVEVRDLSRAGETIDSAMSQLRGVEPGPAIVLLEIGGNDLLAGKPVTEFEEDLEQLLKRVQHPERRLVMFELPLPFMAHRYGWAQRRLSEEFSVTLIPRSVLARIIASPDATLDGLHLSEAGHRRMAEVVWNIAGDALKP